MAPGEQFMEVARDIHSLEYLGVTMNRVIEAVGGFEVASLLSNSWILPAERAEPSLRLFAAEVMPHFSAGDAA